MTSSGYASDEVSMVEVLAEVLVAGEVVEVEEVAGAEVAVVAVAAS